MKQRLVIANDLIYSIFQSVNEVQQVQATGMHMCWDVKRKKAVLQGIYSFDSTFSEMFFTKSWSISCSVLLIKTFCLLLQPKRALSLLKPALVAPVKGKCPFYPLIFDQTRAVNTHLRSHSCEYQNVHNSIPALYSPHWPREKIQLLSEISGLMRKSCWFGNGSQNEFFQFTSLI